MNVCSNIYITAKNLENNAHRYLLCRQAKLAYYNERFIFLAKDVKQTWDVINKALGRGNNKENIPKYFVSNGHILAYNLDIANDLFSSVGPTLTNNIFPVIKKIF